MTPERLFNSFIPPKTNFYTPKKQISGYAPVWDTSPPAEYRDRFHVGGLYGVESPEAKI